MYSILTIICVYAQITVCSARLTVTKSSIPKMLQSDVDREKILFELCPHCFVDESHKKETTYRIDLSVSINGNNSNSPRSLSFKVHCMLCDSLNISLVSSNKTSRIQDLSGSSLEKILFENNVLQSISLFFTLKNTSSKYDILTTINDDFNNKTIYNETIGKSSGCVNKYPLLLISIEDHTRNKTTIVSGDEISFSVSIENTTNTMINNSLKLEVLYAIPKSFLPLIQILCIPSTKFQNVTVSNHFVMNATFENQSQATCKFSSVVGGILPGDLYHVIVYAAYKENSCYASSLLKFEASKISLSYKLSTNGSKLSLGDEFNLTMKLEFPRIFINYFVMNVTFEEEYDGNQVARASLLYTGVYSKEPVSSMNNEMPLPFQHISNGIQINVTNLLSNGNLTLDLVLVMAVENKSIGVTNLRGRLLITGYLMRDAVVPITIYDPTMLPVLDISKIVQVYGKEETFLQVTLFVKHSNQSQHDAYNVGLSDKVTDMSILNTAPSNSVSLYLNGTVANVEIHGYSTMLEVGKSLSVVYTAKYIMTSQMDVFESRAMVSWQSSQMNGENFGPAYSQVTCLKQSLKYRDGFIQNYGFIILGVVMGVVGGVIIAVIIIQCAKRHPNIKKYVIHTNEVEDVKDDEEKQLHKLPDYFSAIEPTTHNEKVQQKKNQNKGLLRGLSKRFSTKVLHKTTAVTTKEDAVDVTIPTIRSSFVQLEYSSILKRIKNTMEGYGSDRWINICSDVEMSCFLPYQLPWQQECETIHKMARKLLVHRWVQLVKDDLNVLCKQQNNMTTLHDIKTNEKVVEFTTNQFQDADSEKSHGKKPSFAASEMLELFQAGMTYYDVMLKTIVKEPTLKLKTGRKRTAVGGRGKDPDDEEQEQQEQANKLKEDYLKMLEERKHRMKEKFSVLFGTVLDVLYHASGARISNQILTQSSLLSLIPSKNGFELVYSWLGNFVSGELFHLRKKHTITQAVYTEFEKIFKSELSQISTHLQRAKVKIFERDEKLLLETYKKQMKIIEKNYTNTTNSLFQDNEKNGLIPTSKEQQNVVDYDQLFKQCCQLADAWKKCTEDVHNGIVNTQTKLLEHVRQACHVFMSRMKVHSQEIHRQKVDEIVELPVADSEVNLREISSEPAQQRNHLYEMLLKVEPTTQNFMNEFEICLERREVHLKEQCEEFDDYFHSLLMKKKSEMKEIKILCKLLVKSTIEAHGPMSWSNSQKIIRKVPEIYLEAILSRFLLDDIYTKNEVPKDVAAMLKNVGSSLASKHELQVYAHNQPIDVQLKTINNKVLDEIEHRFEELKSKVKAGFDISENNNLVKGLLKDDALIDYQEVIVKEALVKISANFLLDIIQQQNISTLEAEKPAVHDGIKEFQKSMKQLLKRADNNEGIDGEQTGDTKETKSKEMSDYLQSYISVCDVFSCDIKTKSNDDDDDNDGGGGEDKEDCGLSAICFDSKEIVKHLMRLDEFSKCLNGRAQTIDNIIDQNFTLITCLKSHGLIGKEDMIMLLKDLSMNVGTFQEFEEITKRLEIDGISMVDVLRVSSKRNKNQNCVTDSGSQNGVRKRVKKKQSSTKRPTAAAS